MPPPGSSNGSRLSTTTSGVSPLYDQVNHKNISTSANNDDLDSEDGFFDQFAFTQPTQKTKSNSTAVHERTNSNSSADSSRTASTHKKSNSNDSYSYSHHHYNNSHKRSSSKGSIHDYASSSSKSFFKFFKKNTNTNATNSTPPVSPIFSNKLHDLDKLSRKSSVVSKKSSSVASAKLHDLQQVPQLPPPPPPQQQQQQQASTPVQPSSSSSSSLASSSKIITNNQALNKPKTGAFEKIGPVGKLPSPVGRTIPVQTSSAMKFTKNTSTATTTNSLKPPLPKLNISKHEIDARFKPKRTNTNKLVMVTNDHKHWKLLSKVNSMEELKNMGYNDLFLTDFGLSESDLGDSLNDDTLKTVLSNENIKILKFYYPKPVPQAATTSASSSVPNRAPSASSGTGTSSATYSTPVKSKNLKLNKRQDFPKLDSQDFSLYNTTSQTNSLNSESSMDKYLSTPQYLIQASSKPSMDYINFKDFQERKPSLTRARSITHSSVQSTPQQPSQSVGQPVPPPQIVSSKSNGSPVTPNDSIKSNSSNFKVIQQFQGIVDFDNKRSTPFKSLGNSTTTNTNTSTTTVKPRPKRNPPPPPPPALSMVPPAQQLQPPIPSFTPPPPPITASASSPDAYNDSNRSPSPHLNFFDNGMRPNTQRSNTVNSIFSINTINNKNDPFKENPISFKPLSTDEDEEEDELDDNESVEQIGHLPDLGNANKVLRSNTINSVFSLGNNNGSNNEPTDPFFENKISFNNISDEDDSNDESESDDDGLFANSKIGKSNNEKKGHVSKLSTSKRNMDLSSAVNKKRGSQAKAEDNNQDVNNGDDSDAEDADDYEDIDANNEELDEEHPNEDDNAHDTDDTDDSDFGLFSKKPENVHLKIRPPPEVLYNNLDFFFPKTDLDKLIISEDGGIQRMKSIRNVAEEMLQNRRRPTLGYTNSNTKIEDYSSSRLRAGTTGSILRRKSTKMWGQKVTEICKNSKISYNASNSSVKEFKWIKGALIGVGKFGKVYIAMNLTTGDLIAVKQMINENKSFNNEIKSLKDLDHVNIVQYLGYQIGEKISSIFLEYVSGGSIGHLLRKYGKFDEPLIQFLNIQMFQGLNYIHSMGLLHCDLKADNLLLETNGILKISDFGISKNSKDLTNKMAFQGTIFWMAPEIINDQNYDKKVDIWSSGCVLIEMFTGSRPWKNFEIEAVLYKLGKEKVVPPIPKNIRESMTQISKDFIKQCLKIDPNDRPETHELLNHPFVKLFDSNSFDFGATMLAQKMNKDESMESDRLSRRMQSMVKKL